jgi:hypothetical protein
MRTPIGWLLDLIGDFISFLIPGKIGRFIAIAVTSALLLALLYVVNHRKFAGLFG